VDFVLDASVTMAWCFNDEVTPYTETVLDRLQSASAAVPAIWPLEVVNVLLVGERRQRLTQAQTARFLELLQALPITVHHDLKLDSLLALGRHHGLSAYDAAYLELAARLGLPLATQDEKLRAAATTVGVSLVR
jgi:predicted nucleic acid-binding protein